MKKFIVAAIAASMALPVYAADLGGRVLNIGSDTTYPPHEFIEDGVVTVSYTHLTLPTNREV